MKKKIQFILYIAIAWLLTACSQDTSMEQESPFAQEPNLPDAPVQMAGLSRSSSLGDTDYGDIRVLLHHDGTTTQGVFKYDNGGEWTTQLKLKSGSRTYRLYGYMPDNSSLSGSITSVTDDAADLRIQGLSPITAQDFCVITGVREVNNTSDTRSAIRGNFSFNYTSSRQNYLNLLFDHLYGRIVFRMKVNADYHDVRTIKVKSMRLQLPSVSQTKADVTLTNEVGLGNASYTITGTDETVLDIRTTEQTLSTTSVEMASAYLIPVADVWSNLVLVTEYDLYDKMGNKVAERTATNKLATALTDLLAGEQRTLSITVEPSYLYILSDSDLNNPTLVLN